MVGTWRALWRFERQQLAACRAERWLPAQVFLLLVVLQAFAFSRENLVLAAAPATLACTLCLSLLLVHSFLFQRDAQDGTLALYRSHDLPGEGLALLKMLVVLYGYALPCLAVLPLALLLLGIPVGRWPEMTGGSVLVVLAMTPLLATSASLGLGSRSQAVLVPLLLLPLMLPSLLCATGVMQHDALAPWLGAGIVVLLWGICPWLCGRAIKMAG